MTVNQLTHIVHVGRVSKPNRSVAQDFQSRFRSGVMDQARAFSLQRHMPVVLERQEGAVESPFVVVQRARHRFVTGDRDRSG